MNNIIKRVLTELETDHPRLDYIRGALETLIEMQEPSKKFVDDVIKHNNELLVGVGNYPSKEPVDEGQALDAMTRARIEKVKALSEKSTELA